MSTGIRYKISNRLAVDNITFYRLSGINPITGNPIYRKLFTHSKYKTLIFSKSLTSEELVPWNNRNIHLTEQIAKQNASGSQKSDFSSPTNKESLHTCRDHLL